MGTPGQALAIAVRGRGILRSSAPCRGVSRSSVVDRNICNFVWYGGVAGDGLRSVGADGELPSSKSVCSILPIVRHLRAGVSRTSHPALRIMGDATRGSPIPLHAGIKAHTLCEENTHLLHIQRFDPSVTEYYNFVSEPGLPISPPPRRPGFSLACAPVRCPKSSLTPLTLMPVAGRIIPDGMGITFRSTWPYRGGAMRGSVRIPALYSTISL